jgi:hypothetical protein
MVAGVIVSPISTREASRLVIAHHYLHRRPAISHAFGLENDGRTVGVMTFGMPPSRHLQIGACRVNPDIVIELNRLWCSDEMPRNTETWFIARCLRLMPPMLIVSFADTAKSHFGIVYRAANFRYAGWTNMNRITPRFDYETPISKSVTDLLGTHQGKSKHSRDASRTHDGLKAAHIERSVKIRYWTATGNARDKKNLMRICDWPDLCWKNTPPPDVPVTICSDGGLND